MRWALFGLMVGFVLGYSTGMLAGLEACDAALVGSGPEALKIPWFGRHVEALRSWFHVHVRLEQELREISWVTGLPLSASPWREALAKAVGTSLQGGSQLVLAAMAGR